MNATISQPGFPFWPPGQPRLYREFPSYLPIPPHYTLLNRFQRTIFLCLGPMKPTVAVFAVLLVHIGMQVAMLVPALCLTYVIGLAILGRAKYG
jgi:hypothetical protein